jgi:hypothetical protein
VDAHLKQAGLSPPLQRVEPAGILKLYVAAKQGKPGK